VGHAHPEVVAAVEERLIRGSHFAQPTTEVAEVAAELSARFGLPLWRFGSSGTEATMDAVHLMRAHTGRDLIVKAEGAYHGHHDTVRAGLGVPHAMSALTLEVRWNDPDDVDRVLVEHGDRIAGVLIEPVVTACGLVPPVPGFLEHVREVTRSHGVLLAFDEVKTGLTVGPGGATTLLGVEPDLVCLAKSLGGGLPAGATGGTEEVMDQIVSGSYLQLGTFNGNPLSMAATRAVLRVLDEKAYRHLDWLAERIDVGLGQAIDAWELPARVAVLGARGSVTFRSEPVIEYRDFLEVDQRYHRAAWLHMYNRGVFLLPWGRGLQWLLSVQHDAADADRFVEAFAGFGAALRG
ncbi:MAG TPA: aminotransferase class III-fold pyridoxal phosphate-dependent enzyme, partial [Acidimicrobiia bacterium]|nr:aminotransferase class III-fold pyridoxal phosphate-dependent enzyme [Acidimicrobiia bacterium]